MLKEIIVKNFAIIDHVHLELGSGLNIMSGETGAGKSVIVRSLALLMGAKSNSSDIRVGSETATVEGCFDIENRDDILTALNTQGIPVEEDTLVVRRSIAKEGKNRVYINGHMSTLNDLKKIISPLVEVTGQSAPLIEMTGQHDNKNLLSPIYHMDLLDTFAKHHSLRIDLKQYFSEIDVIDAKISRLQGNHLENSQRIDFLAYQIREIDSLALDPEQDLLLEDKIKQLRKSDSLNDFFEEARDFFENSDLLARLKYFKDKMATMDSPEVTALKQNLEQVFIHLDEISYSLNTHSEEDSQKEQLSSLEQRLSDIRRIQRKFGSELADIIHQHKQMKVELFELENRDAEVAQLELQKKAIFTKVNPVIKKLSASRRKSADQLTSEVNKHLKQLNMNGVHFLVRLEDKEPSVNGAEKVLFEAHNGDQQFSRPIHKTASGGELSRMLLALKVAADVAELPRTYLFDEVDTGVSGPTAEKVGKKLKMISKGQQVICITHLPQVAAFGDRHYLVSKKTSQGLAKMKAYKLSKQERIDEVARLISGTKLSKTSRDHATHLISNSK